MKPIKNATNKAQQVLRKSALSVSMLVISGLSYATPQDGDIVKTLIGGSIGKTLSKEGNLWPVLIAVTFAVGGFYAAIKSDPKAFIPAFIVMGLISTVTGVFLTF